MAMSKFEVRAEVAKDIINSLIENMTIENMLETRQKVSDILKELRKSILIHHVNNEFYLHNNMIIEERRGDWDNFLAQNKFQETMFGKVAGFLDKIRSEVGEYKNGIKDPERKKADMAADASVESIAQYENLEADLKAPVDMWKKQERDRKDYFSKDKVDDCFYDSDIYNAGMLYHNQQSMANEMRDSKIRNKIKGNIAAINSKIFQGRKVDPEKAILKGVDHLTKMKHKDFFDSLKQNFSVLGDDDYVDLLIKKTYNYVYPNQDGMQYGPPYKKMFEFMKNYLSHKLLDPLGLDGIDEYIDIRLANARKNVKDKNFVVGAEGLEIASSKLKNDEILQKIIGIANKKENG
ncbi:MAG: hypothetical protein LBO78_02225 [Rickettsiales bacterium]|jgi:hypothetical protein|nr:hypothetical protein [Rickettsiales bacterium]